MASQYLTPDALGFVEDAIMQASNTTSFSIFGGVVLLWAVLKVFRTLDKAFSELYQVNSDPGLLEQFVDGLTVLGVMAAATLAMVAVGTALSLAGAIPLASNLPAPAFRALGLLALVVGLSVVFLAMYYVFPDPDMTVRGALPGAVFAAVGWTLLQGLFQVYVSMANPSRLYGVLGGIILFITWLYFSAVIILTGAGVNIVLSGQRWSTG
jgi:membrane protein